MSSILLEEHETGVDYVPLSFGLGGPNELAPAIPGKKHRIIGGMLSFPADGTLDLLSGSTSLFGGAMAFGAFGGFLCAPGFTFLETLPGEALNLTSTGSIPRGFFKIITEDA